MSNPQVVATHQRFLCHSLAIPRSSSGVAVGPAAGVRPLGVVVAQVAFQVELEAGLPGRPQRLVADKGYSFPSIRTALRRRGIAAVIPTRSDQRRQPGFDRQAHRQRNRVERSVGRPKQFRRVATRHEKPAVNYLAWVTLATTMVWP